MLSRSLPPIHCFAFFQMILIVKDIPEWEHLHSTTNKKKMHMLYHTSRSSWFIHETQKRICWYCSTNSGAKAHITAISDNRWKSKWIRQDLTLFACTSHTQISHRNGVHTHVKQHADVREKVVNRLITWQRLRGQTSTRDKKGKNEKKAEWVEDRMRDADEIERTK